MKMCWSIRRVLGAYQDGTLGQRRAQRVARHLHTCPAAANESFRVLQRVTRLLQSFRVLHDRLHNGREHSGSCRKFSNGHRVQSDLQLVRLPHGLRQKTQRKLSFLSPSRHGTLGTVTFLGLEDEAFIFFTSYLLPIVLQ